MGGAVTKEARPRSSSQSLASSIPSGYNFERNRRNTIFGNPNDYKKTKKQEEKDKLREENYMKFIVRYSENVDGGYLAPHGTYKSNLDFNIDIVRNLIINRKLAPFYTPLQDFNEDWREEELLIIVKQLQLHSMETAYEEEDEEDDIDDHKIHKSSNYFKRQEQKTKLKTLISKIKDLQKDEDNRFLELKLKLNNQDPNLPSDDLLLLLYKNAIECPICFLYYPNNLNLSRCCLQPICTECFVQIKRLDPHPPHDQALSSREVSDQSNEEIPHTLISEPANCPYCAMNDFGVTFEKTLKINTGINGIKPQEFSLKHAQEPLEKNVSGNVSALKHINNIIHDENDESAISSSSSPTEEIIPFKERSKRRSSIPANSPKVVTVDQIRPDWETKLIAAKARLAKKAAAASAIHASNLIMNAQSDLAEYDTRNRNNDTQFQSIEDRMIEEALRLSIIDEEDRVRRQGTPQLDASI